MKNVCVLLLLIIVILNLAGVMLGIPASPEKMQFIFSLSAGVSITVLLFLILSKQDKKQ